MNYLNCLIVLQPRLIPRAVESIAALPIDKAWFTAFTEPQLVPAIAAFVNRTHYTNYIFVADDVIVEAKALETVNRMLEHAEAATGYCRLSRHHPLVNITRKPVRMLNPGETPAWDDYDFHDYSDVQGRGCFPVWFGGWSLTGMRRYLLVRHPFAVSPAGCHSDYMSSMRICQAGTPFMTHHDAYIDHLKEHHDSALRSGWLVGSRAPSVTLDLIDT